MQKSYREVFIDVVYFLIMATVIFIDNNFFKV